MESLNQGGYVSFLTTSKARPGRKQLERLFRSGFCFGRSMKDRASVVPQRLAKERRRRRVTGLVMSWSSRPGVSVWWTKSPTSRLSITCAATLHDAQEHRIKRRQCAHRWHGHTRSKAMIRLLQSGCVSRVTFQVVQNMLENFHSLARRSCGTTHDVSIGRQPSRRSTRLSVLRSGPLNHCCC